jgi:type III secretion protein N (ATPase)
MTDTSRHPSSGGIAPRQYGKIVDVRGVLIRVAGLSLQIGERVRITPIDSGRYQEGEVVGLERDHALVMPLEGVMGLSNTCEVEGLGATWARYDARKLLGRAIDGLGRPLDGQPPPEQAAAAMPPSRTSPLERPLIDQHLTTGIRAIDAFLTCGIGQRIGIFAPAGVGKSSLLGALTRNVETDAVVVAMIGERGREVAEFLCSQPPDRRSRILVVASTSERPPAEKIKAADLASNLAVQLRERGMNVLLLFDSLTRFARAVREVGLAVGESPSRGGFPPSVFSRLPLLLEAGGRSRSGSITAFYTILTEDEDASDPVSEEARSLLDGHIQLSSSLANAGHYPAIDLLRSKSRLMSRLASHQHQLHASRCRGWLSSYQEVELLMQMGEYVSGGDIAMDRAIDRHPHLIRFLQQADDYAQSWEQTQEQLDRLCNEAAQT